MSNGLTYILSGDFSFYLYLFWNFEIKILLLVPKSKYSYRASNSHLIQGSFRVGIEMIVSHNLQGVFFSFSYILSKKTKKEKGLSI